MDAYLIIGHGNQRKSSTIRALTGVCQKDIFEIATNGGNILQTYIQIQSLQEASIAPQQFISEVSNSNCDSVLTSLRVGSMKNVYPYCVSYIQAFQNAGWNIRGIVVLGLSNLPHGYNLPQGVPVPIFIGNILPTNQIASIVRNQWNWL